MTRKTGLLLINLGTPNAPTAAAVRPYLREFLMDPRVITAPGPLRWLLVNLVIAPFRAPKSAHAYESVWTERGSPLLVASKELTEEVRRRFEAEEKRGGPGVQVELAMRYGEPSIPSAMARFKAAGIERLVVFPLYPQYSSAATGSSMERVVQIAQREWAMPAVSFVPAFYDHPAFLDAVVAAGRETLEAFQPDHVMFSYHGLPGSHVTKCDPTGQHCLKAADCCERIVDANASCYRAQCVATTRGLKQRLGLKDSESSIAFQSRLGREEWVKPYTDELLIDLAKKGKKRLAVFCPAFVADCLETLEEIGIRAKEDFVAAGGDDLALIPCVNAHPTWVDGVVHLARESSAWLGSSPAAAVPRGPRPLSVVSG